MRDEVGARWPSFQRRDLDWAACCRRHTPRVRAGDPIAGLRAWLAELGDAHTWVRPTEALGRLPYEVSLSQREAVLVEVPEDSLGHAAGARVGARVLGVDCGPLWRTTAASTHARGLIAGRHLMSGPIGKERVIEVRAPGGQRIAWREAAVDPYATNLVRWGLRSSGAGYLRVRAWLPAAGPAISQALQDLQGVPVLILDLRGNGGGLSSLAHALRDRLIDRRRQLGWRRVRVPGAGLTEAAPLWAIPSQQPWPGSIRILTDPLTFSASEELLLGLQGQENVRILGTASGGGSGPVQVLPLLPGWKLCINTGLVYDLRWRCIEGVGLPVDQRFSSRRSTGPDALVLRAER